MKAENTYSIHICGFVNENNNKEMPHKTPLCDKPFSLKYANANCHAISNYQFKKVKKKSFMLVLLSSRKITC